MVNNKRHTKIVNALNTLNKNDIYSLMLFTLYKFHDDPKYITLSELSYVLDGTNLNKFLSYFGGMTITIPTLREMRLMVQTLLLYQYVNIEGGNFDETLTVVAGEEFTKEEVKELYIKLLQILAEYEFDRKEIN